MIRVAVVDDQTLMRQGLKSLLERTEDIRVAIEAADGDEAVRVVLENDIDVVLMDVRMPGRSGIEALRALRDAGREVPTVLLTTFDDDSVVLDGIRAGARGFLLKDVAADDLAQAVRTVARGGTLWRPAVTERVLSGLAGKPTPFESLTLPDRLTEREREVLRLMAGGFSNREIAEALGTAEGTVKNHASSVLSKLGVRDRTRAVLRALELGWI